MIDARQSEAQNTVIEALRGLGHNEAADHYTHFSYEMVALTPRCAAELGYTLSEEDKARSYIEVSGRKGFGVKADDLLDQLIASAKNEVDSRHPAAHRRRAPVHRHANRHRRPALLHAEVHQAIGDRLRFQRSAQLRRRNRALRAVRRGPRRPASFKKAGIDPDTFCRDIASKVSAGDLAKFLAGDSANEIWELWLAASKTSYIVDQCIATTEPAYLAKHAFQLAQLFNTFYHRHPILSEPDEKRKQFLLATVAVVRRELIRTLAVMGITVPPVM